MVKGFKMKDSIADTMNRLYKLRDELKSKKWKIKKDIRNNIYAYRNSKRGNIGDRRDNEGLPGSSSAGGQISPVQDNE